jgi:hypothetical protein
MAKQNRTTLKGYFETGDIPTGGNYVDLIDSPLILDTENTGSINILGTITASGDISASGKLTVANIDLEPGGAISPISNNQTISFRAADHGSGEFMEIGSDIFNVYMNGSNALNMTPSILTFNSNNADQDVRINFDNGAPSYISDAASYFTRMQGPVVITRSGSATVRTPLGSGYNAVTDGNSALQLSGSLWTDGHITASGNISASGTISAFGSSSLVGLPTTEPSITGALWLSGSGGGSASGSKYLMVFTG